MLDELHGLAGNSGDQDLPAGSFTSRQLPPFPVRPGKRFELGQMSKARMRAGFGDLQDDVNVNEFLFDPFARCGTTSRSRSPSVFL
jgi:hypothetical protein